MKVNNIKGGIMKKDSLNINCSVHDCIHCDCACNKCKLESIKVCNCGCECNKENTMCDSYKKRQS